jgi:hypothetical protein
MQVRRWLAESGRGDPARSLPQLDFETNSDWISQNLSLISPFHMFRSGRISMGIRVSDAEGQTGVRRATALLSCVTGFFFLWITPVHAKQECSVAAPSNTTKYWSWRLIDGRKCWYQGAPGLSKALLEWPAQVPLTTVEELADAEPEKPRNPLNSQALAPAEPDSFEALWQRRIRGP